MEAYLSRVVLYLAGQSWQIAILTLVVAVITFLLRNRSAHVRYLLWLIVLAKCLVPPWFAVTLDVIPSTTTGPASTATAWLSSDGRGDSEEGLAPSEMVVAPLGGSPPAQVPVVRVHPWSIPAQLGLIWLAGLVLYLTINLLRALRAEWWFRRRRRPLPEPWRQRIAEILGLEGAKDAPTVWLLDEIGQPFVWGLLRGSIYLPTRFLDLDDAQRQRGVLLHEIGHIVRFDAAINLLQVAAQAVFWFHPFVWWASRQIRQEREKCCDEMAIARLGATPKDYGTAILSTLIQAQESTRPVPSLAVAGPVKNIEERIRTMLKPGKRFHTRPSLAVATAVVLIALVAVPTTLVLTARAEVQPTAQSVDKPATDSGKPEQPRLAARTFNSKLAFGVIAHETSRSKERWIGQTPSDTPLEIPACWMWQVVVWHAGKDQDVLASEIDQNKIPGLFWHLATDSDLSYLAGLKGLHSLGLGYAQITDAGLAHLEGLTGLWDLDLWATRITDEGLKHLKGLTGLQVLLLARTRITDVGLENLKGLTKLQNLNLSQIEIGNSGLAFLKDLKELQELTVGGAQITDAGLESLDGLTGLQRLWLSAPRVTDAGLEHLKGLTRLQGLGLDKAQITDAGLAHLSGLFGLEVLGLSETRITDRGLSHLKDMAGLQVLTLSGTQIADAGLANIEGLTKLQRLDVSSTQITDAALVHFKGLTGLQRLELYDTQITGEGLQNLKGLTQLESLWLNRTRITDAGLAHIEALTGLRALDLALTPITDAGLEHLGVLTRLRFLELYGTKITGLGFSHLNALTGLEELFLRDCPITDAGLESLKGLTGLQNLSLNGAAITDAGLVHLKDLTQLKWLGLSDCRVTNVGLEHLRGLNVLMGLSLAGTQVTDSGLEQMRSLPGLKSLDVSRTQVTDAGVQQLKQSLPNLKIIQ